MYYIYVLGCEDGSLYCGITTDIKRRIHAHFYHLAESAKYTKSHQVVSVEAVWQTESATGARKAEYRFKQLKRGEKLLLLASPEKISDFLPSLSEYKFSYRKEINLAFCIEKSE